MESSRVIIEIEFDNKVNIYNPGNRKIMDIATILQSIVDMMQQGDYTLSFADLTNGK